MKSEELKRANSTALLKFVEAIGLNNRLTVDKRRSSIIQFCTLIQLSYVRNLELDDILEHYAIALDITGMYEFDKDAAFSKFCDLIGWDCQKQEVIE